MRTIASLSFASILFAACTDAEPTQKGDELFEVAMPGKADGSGLLSAADETRLTAAFDRVVAEGEETIAQLEQEIAELEADHRAKQQEADALVQTIASREAELESDYNSNLLLCAFVPNPATCILANYLANDSTLTSYKRQLEEARSAQARIAADMQAYARKRDTLRTNVDDIRAGKQRLLNLLRDNQGPTAPPPELASSPESARAYWRTNAMTRVSASIEEEIALLVELRNAAVELSTVLDQSLSTLRALEQSVDELVEQSREQFMGLVSALLSGEPAAHADKWLDEALAKKTRELLQPLGWPLNEFARFVVERSGSPEALIQRILHKLLGDLAPEPVLYEANTRANLYDQQTARSPIYVTTTRPAQAVDIYVDISHTHVGDLDVWVEHDGQAWTLSRNDGGTADSLRKTWSVDTTGIAISGAWTLVIKDSYDQDEGQLNRWTLVVR